MFEETNQASGTELDLPDSLFGDDDEVAEVTEPEETENTEKE